MRVLQIRGRVLDEGLALPLRFVSWSSLVDLLEIYRFLYLSTRGGAASPKDLPALFRWSVQLLRI